MRSFSDYLNEKDPQMLDEMNKYLAGGLAAGALAAGGHKASAEGASTADQIAAITQKINQAQDVQNQWEQLKKDIDSGKTKLDFKNPAHRNFVTYNPKYHPDWVEGGDNTDLLRQLDAQKKMSVIMGDAEQTINPTNISGLAAKLKAKLATEKAKDSGSKKGEDGGSAPTSMKAAERFLKYAN